MTDLMIRPTSVDKLPKFGVSNRNNLVSDLFGFDPLRTMLGSFGNYGFSGDIQKTDNGWNIEIPVAGYKPEEIQITVDNDILTISGQGERRNFQRSLYLPDSLDSDNITARVEHGMLNLNVPLHPKSQPKKIEITSS